MSSCNRDKSLCKIKEDRNRNKLQKKMGECENEKYVKEN